MVRIADRRNKYKGTDSVMDRGLRERLCRRHVRLRLGPGALCDGSDAVDGALWSVRWRRRVCANCMKGKKKKGRAM